MKKQPTVFGISWIFMQIGFLTGYLAGQAAVCAVVWVVGLSWVWVTLLPIGPVIALIYLQVQQHGSCDPAPVGEKQKGKQNEQS